MPNPARVELGGSLHLLFPASTVQRAKAKDLDCMAALMGNREIGLFVVCNQLQRWKARLEPMPYCLFWFISRRVSVDVRVAENL